MYIVDEDHILLSEKLEDQLKAVKWAREQKKKILDDKADVSLDILASGNLNSENVETGVPEHGNRLDWLNGYLSGTTHLSSPEPLCGAKQALRLS